MPGVGDGALDRGPELAQPRGIAGEFPVAVGDEHVAEEAIGAGASLLIGFQTQREAQPEGHAAGGGEVVGVVRLAHGARQSREEERQCLGVVPDMGAASLATAAGAVAALEAVEGAVLEAHHGGRLEDREVGGDGVEHAVGQRAGEERLLEAARGGLEAVPVLEGVGGTLARAAGPGGGVPVLPAPRQAGGVGGLAGRGIPVVLAGGEVPGDQEADALAGAGGEIEMGGQGAVVALAGLVEGVGALAERARGAEVAHHDLQIIKPAAAEAVVLHADAPGVGHEGQLAPGGIVSRDAAGGEVEPLERGAGGVLVELGPRQGVAERGGERNREGPPAAVGHLVAEEGAGESRVAVVVGDEGVEGCQPHLAGAAGIREADLGKGVGGTENGAAEVGHPRQQAAVRSEAESGKAPVADAGVSRAQVALHDAQVNGAALLLAAQRDMRVAVEAALAGVVGDLPVYEAAIAAKADAAGTEAPQRETDGCLAVAGIVD